MAPCLPEEDVHATVVYFNIEVGFGRLRHGRPHAVVLFMR
jgi:hypothetical protein